MPAKKKTIAKKPSPKKVAPKKPTPKKKAPVQKLTARQRKKIAAGEKV